MTKVKLLSNLQLDTGVAKEGAVVDLPSEQADKLIELGAAEPTDEKVGDAPAPEVEPAADPLVTTQAAGEQTPNETPENPVSAEQSTPQPPASSTPNLHLG